MAGASSDRPAGPRPSLAAIPGLDGLRGAAVAVVVGYHLELVPGGFLGVDAFFVLSGFLVTSLLLAELDQAGGRLSLRRFWARRARRLVPAVVVLVPVVLAAAVVLGWPRNRLGAATWDGFSTLTWWANWRQASGTSYWAAATPNLFRHAWSLSIEEQFYLAWPVVVLGTAALARRRGWSARRAVGVAAAVGVMASATWLTVLAHRLRDDQLSRAYVGTDTRVLAPLLGCALACWWAGRPAPGARSRAPQGWRLVVPQVLAALALAGLAALVATVRVSDPWLYRGGGFVAAAVAAAVLVGVVAWAQRRGVRSWPTAWSTWGPLRYLGLRSYGIYLWSWPVQVLFRHRFETAPRVVEVAVVVALALALAEASHRLVEDPVRRVRGWAATPRLRRPAWAFAVGAPLAALLVASSLAVPPPAQERFDTAASARAALQAPPTGGRPAGLRVVVEGDSVAWTVGYFSPKGDDLPLAISSIDSRAYIGCGVLAGTGWEYRSGGRWDEAAGGQCRSQPRAERRGLSGRPHVVVTSPGAWEAGSARSPGGEVVPARSERMHDVLVRALVARAVAAHRAGAAFALVAWSCPGPDAARQRRDPAYVRWINRVLADAAATARERGADAWVVEPTAAVCEGADPTAAPTAAKDAATGDEVHIQSDAGGRWIWATWLAPALAAHLS